MDLVLTEVAWRTDEDRLRAAAPGARWLRMQGDGALLDDDGATVARDEDADAELDPCTSGTDGGCMVPTHRPSCYSSMTG